MRKWQTIRWHDKRNGAVCDGSVMTIDNNGAYKKGLKEDAKMSRFGIQSAVDGEIVIAVETCSDVISRNGLVGDTREIGINCIVFHR